MKLQKPGAKTDTNYFCFSAVHRRDAWGKGRQVRAAGLSDDHLKARLRQESRTCRIRPAGLREL